MNLHRYLSLAAFPYTNMYNHQPHTLHDFSSMHPALCWRISQTFFGFAYNTARAWFRQVHFRKHDFQHTIIEKLKYKTTDHLKWCVHATNGAYIFLISDDWLTPPPYARIKCPTKHTLGATRWRLLHRPPSADRQTHWTEPSSHSVSSLFRFGACWCDFWNMHTTPCRLHHRHRSPKCMRKLCGCCNPLRARNKFNNN